MTDANKAPSYPWYPRDFAADEPVQLMTLAEEGAYRRLLDHQWLHGSVPGEVEQLARICKNVPVKEMRKMWPSIESCFEKMRGLPVRLQNRKLERVRADREAFMSRARESGKRGGEEASKRRREKQGEHTNPTSDPTTDPMPSATETLVAEQYPAVCSLRSASAEVTTADAVPQKRPHDLSSVLGLVVEKLYFGNRPLGGAMSNEASIAKLLAKTYGYDRLAVAIEGLAKRREAGEIPNVGRRQAMSLKWLNSNKFEVNQLAISEDAVYRTSDPRKGKGGSAGLGDILADIGRTA